MYVFAVSFCSAITEAKTAEPLNEPALRKYQAGASVKLVTPGRLRICAVESDVPLGLKIWYLISKVSAGTPSSVCDVPLYCAQPTPYAAPEPLKRPPEAVS